MGSLQVNNIRGVLLSSIVLKNVDKYIIQELNHPVQLQRFLGRR